MHHSLALSTSRVNFHSPRSPSLFHHPRRIALASRVTVVESCGTVVTKDVLDPSSSHASWLSKHPSIARTLVSMKHADECVEVMVDAENGCPLEDGPCVSEADALMLIDAALEKGNTQLALSIHDMMCRAARYRSGSARSTLDASLAWPPATINVTAGVVLGLCRQLAIDEAMSVVEGIKLQGIPSHDQVNFGVIVTSPLAPKRTLSVIGPREGNKLVCDAYSKYEFELFTGEVTSCSSEAMTSSTSGLLFQAAQKVGLAWAVGGEPVGAVHQLTLQAPDGSSRTFRVATTKNDVPGQKGDRVTVVSAPFKNSVKATKGLLTASPPNTKPGQAMASTNHRTGQVLRLLQPPAPGKQAGIPSWVLPAAVIFVGGDVASTLLDPSLPAIIAGSMAFSVGSVATGANLVLPKLKQLSDKEVALEYTRQKLLGEYNSLSKRVNATMQEIQEDVRVISQLWQLQVKMESVSGAQSYSARIDRVAAARVNVESRMARKLELIEGYCRVMKMIEIEVEMDMAVPAAELSGIEEQLQRLMELERLQDEWKVQAEARDEIEKLLKVA